MDFGDIRGIFRKCEAHREKTIQLSRDVIRLSKLVIYSIHRNELEAAEKYLKEIRGKARGLGNIAYDTGIHDTAYQEYVEAVCYYDFVKGRKLANFKGLGVSPEQYLMGLCDLTGELMRRAVNSAIRKDFTEVLKIRNFVDELYGEFLKFDLRNSELRRKSDSIKWNLQKIEGLLVGQ